MSQSPAWGAPANAAWGSPLVNSSTGSNNQSNKAATPDRQSGDNNRPSLSQGGNNSFRGRNQGFSPGGAQYSYSASPRHFQPRPRYQSSPLHSRNSSFGYNTPPPRNQNSSYNMYTPSPRHQDSSFIYTPSPHQRNHSHQGNNSFRSQRNSLTPRNSMNNPGGSDDINDYIHPSMLEDPWKDLKPMPMFQHY